MSYQQGNRPGAPYPQQSGGAPYPNNNSPYPSINPNSFGYNSNAPLQMPQPINIPTYSPSAPSVGYPSLSNNFAGYPSTSNNYPPAPTVYPGSSNNAYQNTPSSGLPPVPVGHSSNGYCPNFTGYHPEYAGYPPASSPYPGVPASSPYPSGAPAATPGGQNEYAGPRGPYGGVSYTNTPSNIQTMINKPKRTPTVTAASPFNPRGDAEILRKAMKGFGTDEKAIINVLAHRTNLQRLQIAVEFKTLYGKDLIKDLKSETTGNFENTLVAMMTPLPEYYAKELHDAMQGLGTEENVLIEVLCTKSNQEILIINQAYHALYFKSLEEDLRGDTAGTFKRLMISLCNAGRDESMVVNQDAARADAQALLRAGELRLGTDESTFNAVFCQRNWAQLQLIFQEYERLTGHDIEKAIKNEFSGDAEEGLLAVVRSIKNQSAFFAKCLNKSMKGLGTNDRDLIRLIVTRCEVDMVEIKREYQAKYGESLADAIKGDCSGHYKKCLLHLIAEA